MTSESKLIYRTNIKRFEDISPKSVILMLQDVRVYIGKLETSFAKNDLSEIVAIVESGSYKINGSVSTCVDLSSAKGVINTYREYSEGGCKSCISLGREVIDAQDATTGWYCKISDPDYDADTPAKDQRVRYEGFSPKVKEYYDAPCNSWKPKFSLKLEELIEKEN
jgi:hypothetical protein